MPTAPGVCACVRASTAPGVCVLGWVKCREQNCTAGYTLYNYVCKKIYIQNRYFSLQNRYFSLQNRSFFFHLGLVLCFYLHLINRRPHLSESRHLIFLSEKSIFYE